MYGSLVLMCGLVLVLGCDAVVVSSRISGSLRRGPGRVTTIVCPRSTFLIGVSLLPCVVGVGFC